MDRRPSTLFSCHSHGFSPQLSLDLYTPRQIQKIVVGGDTVNFDIFSTFPGEVLQTVELRVSLTRGDRPVKHNSHFDTTAWGHLEPH